MEIKEKITELVNEHLRYKEEIAIINEKDELVKANIKLLLREEGINKINDLNGNIVSYGEQMRETIDKNRVKELIGELQFNTVVRKSTFEILRITTKKQQEYLKNVAK